MAANWTTFVDGDVLEASQLNGVVDNFADIAIFNETQASGTNGGASIAATWTKRVLNTTNINNIAGASIASSVITLAAGTYLVNASSPFYSVNSAKIRLQNTTDATTTITGTSEYFKSTTEGAGKSNLTGLVTISASKNFELQYYAQSVKATDGLGVATSAASISEVYSVIEITRVA
jgi:hypothetical protein